MIPDRLLAFPLLGEITDDVIIGLYWNNIWWAPFPFSSSDVCMNGCQRPLKTLFLLLFREREKTMPGVLFLFLLMLDELAPREFFHTILSQHIFIVFER